MKDLPALVHAATIWAYWACVGAMIVRTARRTRGLAGIVPGEAIEKAMWLAWLPLVAAWLVLPFAAAVSAEAPFALPEWARSSAVRALRWAAAGAGLACLAASMACWRRMGRHWRIAVDPGMQTELVTTGLYAHLRHPIYALSMALVSCTAIVVPTPAVGLIALLHIGLMNLKARHEERFLARRDDYRRYMQRTGRFLPRLRGPGR